MFPFVSKFLSSFLIWVITYNVLIPCPSRQTLTFLENEALFNRAEAPVELGDTSMASADDITVVRSGHTVTAGSNEFVQSRRGSGELVDGFFQGSQRKPRHLFCPQQPDVLLERDGVVVSQLQAEATT